MTRPRSDGVATYQVVLFVCVSVALAFAGDALVGTLENASRGVDWTGLCECFAGLLMLSVSVVATINGGRAGVWRFSASDVLFALAKGLTLVVLLAISRPERSPANWSLVAATYAVAVVLHLGHVRNVISDATRHYRSHLRAAQRGAAVLAVIMAVCFTLSCITRPTMEVHLAPVTAAAISLFALIAESKLSRASSI